MIGEDTVDLFRHYSIEGAQARFHVRHQDLKFSSSKRTGKCRVNIPDNYNQLRSMFQTDLLESHHVARDLFHVST